TPPASALVASNVSMSSNNYVMSGTTLLGYKYVLSGLTANSTYYFKIIAKKAYLEFVDNALQTTMYESLPAMKVIITPAAGPIDQPVVPNRPPFALKTVDGVEEVTGTTAKITLMNKWYEEYTELSGDGRGEWVYRTAAELDAISPTLVYRMETEFASTSPAALTVSQKLTEAERLKYRIVKYDSGVTLDVGCIDYVSGFDYTTLTDLTADRVTGFPVTANDATEVVSSTSPVRDGAKHNIDITLEGLTANSTYIIWIRAARRSVSLISGPSDPIVVTTNPDIQIPLEKPTVPVFNYYEASDTYVNLGWNVKAGYDYNLKYSTTDNITTASKTLAIKAADLLGTSYYKVSGLTPSTIYYFWIQAVASNAAGETSSSEWSDSLILKTKAYQPPETPKGFGVSGATDAVTKNSITYEWIQVDGLDYILEIATDVNYTNPTVYTVGKLSTYTVTGLRSNLRYYARLYAYDSTKKLKSEPTQSAIVRTDRSQDDYDSDQDVENVLDGEFVDIGDSAINHVWTVKIIGANGERFVQHVQKDNKLDYQLDLTDAPTGTQIVAVSVSGPVLKALSSISENLLIKTTKNTLVIRPGVLATDNSVSSKTQSKETVFGFYILLEGAVADTDTTNLKLKTSATQLSVTKALNGNVSEVNQFEKPMKVVYDYTDVKWYTEGLTSGYTVPLGKTKWTKQATRAAYDPDNSSGSLSFETGMSGRMAVAEPGKSYYDDTSKHWANSSINNVASVHTIKAVTGRTFEPDKYVTNSDAVKFMLDMIDYKYGSNYMSIGVKAGLITSAEASTPSIECTREKLVAMAVRIYELKASEKAVATRNDTGIYKDASSISSKYLSKVKYAVENGIAISRLNNIFGPKDPVTRGELMSLLEKLLVYSGEL
ncbi:MAG: fibronectin type III domain-containing protein, partial [Clostridiales bacterium]|nr:fibronectin type III domain-containing protein [Clostridiales bacterium]